MKAHFERIFAHRRWANRRTLAALLDCPAAHADAVPVWAHLFAAEHIWLARLRGATPTLPVWPGLTLEQSQALMAECDDGWAAYLGGLADDAALHADVEYRDSRGEPFRNTAADVLTHAYMHGQYHRGQIAKMIGRAGGKTQFTDFIVFVRSEGVDVG